MLLVGIGAMAATAMDVAQRLEAQGFGVTVVDPRWVKPVDPKLVELAASFKLVVTIEDNGRAGGCGSMIAQALRDAGVGTPVRDFGIPQEFLQHAKRPAVLQEIGLTGQELAREITELIAQHHGDALNEPAAADRAAPEPAGPSRSGTVTEPGRHAHRHGAGTRPPPPDAGLAGPAVAGSRGGRRRRRSCPAQLQRSGGGSGAAVATTPDIDLAARAAAVDKVLKKRAQAVLTDNEKDFLADVDPANKSLVARQRTLFTNLRQFGFARLAYQQLAQQYDDAITKKYGPSTYLVAIAMAYQIRGIDTGPGPRDARLHVHRAADRRMDAGVRHRPGQAAAARIAPGGVGHRRRAGEARTAGSRGRREGPGAARDQAGRRWRAAR